MTQFKIIEQESRNLSELYPLFKKEYMNPNNTVSDVKEILHLSNSEYRHLRKELHQETGIEIKPNNFNPSGFYDTPDRYIHRRGRAFEIRKGRKYYGRFKTIEDARVHRDKLKEVNWDTEKL